MSNEEFAVTIVLPGVIAALVISLLLGYGRRIGAGLKVVGWLFALAVLAMPVLYLSAGPQFNKVGSAPNPTWDRSAEEAPDTPSKRRRSDTRERSTRGRPVEQPRNPARTYVPPVDKSEETDVAEETDGAAPDDDDVVRTYTTPPGDVASPKIEEEFDRVDILFGTDRNTVEDGPLLTFGSERARRLTLGATTVTVPKDHKPGKIERPWNVTVFGITLHQAAENPAKHFTVQDIEILSEDAFIAAANRNLTSGISYRGHAAVFVHGYNNDFDIALYRTAQMAYDMNFDGATFLYSWPSAAGYTTYEYDQQSARQSIDHLREFIEIVTQKTNATKVHLVAHSLGNDPLLEALRELRFEYGKEHDYKISQVILAAPDVDRHVFERLASQVVGIVQGMTLYASANDKALRVSKNYAGGVARAGEVPRGGPVLLQGVDTIDVSNTQQDFWGVNHNTYAETSELLEDIRKLFLTGKKPPDRTPKLEEVPLDDRVYWRFP